MNRRLERNIRDMVNVGEFFLQVHRLIRPLISWVQVHRTLFTIAAGILFLGGITWSLANLNLSFSDIALAPLVLLALVLVPLSLVYGGVGLQLLARVAGINLNLFSATRSASAAQLAEVLPLPGGAIVRTGALISAGAKAGDGAILVLSTAVMWIAIAGVGAGYAMFSHGVLIGLPLLIVGFLVACAILIWIVVRAGWSVAAQILFHRIAGLLLTVLRLSCAFAIINAALPLDGVLVFAFAGILGSAASIAPAGLGISEIFAAILAPLIAVDPAAAFLAVALNRLIGLSVTAVIVMATEIAQNGTIRSKVGG